MTPTPYRPTYAALALIIACGGIACTTVELPEPPPQPAPNVPTFTLTTVAHQLAYSNTEYVKASLKHAQEAIKVWRQCAVAVVFDAVLFNDLTGNDPQNNDNIVFLGAKFPATDVVGNPHTENWYTIERAGFRFPLSSEKGSDSHYTREIWQYKGNPPTWVNSAGGLTEESLTGSRAFNFSVVRPLEGGQLNLILGHEMGHQLGLRDKLDQGNLMCDETGCAGLTLTGAINHPNPLAPNTQCTDARNWGDQWDLFENP